MQQNPEQIAQSKLPIDVKKRRRHHLNDEAMDGTFAGRRPTYAQWIASAIASAKEKAMTLADINEWMIQNVPGLAAQRYMHSCKGWKNAVRHTLSINRHRFRKIPQNGRPSLWSLYDGKCEPSANGHSKTSKSSFYEEQAERAIPFLEAQNLNVEQNDDSFRIPTATFCDMNDKSPALEKSGFFDGRNDAQFGRFPFSILPVQQLHILCIDGTIKKVLLPTPLPLTEANFHGLLNQAVSITNASLPKVIDLNVALSRVEILSFCAMSDDVMCIGNVNKRMKTTYAEWITRAIQSSPTKSLALAEINDWMANNVPGLKNLKFLHSSQGWKNAVRHTLSVNRSRFEKVPREGRPSLWTLAAKSKEDKSPTAFQQRQQHFAVDCPKKLTTPKSHGPNNNLTLMELEKLPINCSYALEGQERKEDGDFGHERCTQNYSNNASQTTQTIQVIFNDGIVAAVVLPKPLPINGLNNLAKHEVHFGHLNLPKIPVPQPPSQSLYAEMARFLLYQQLDALNRIF